MICTVCNSQLDVDEIDAVNELKALGKTKQVQICTECLEDIIYGTADIGLDDYSIDSPK